jgi:hypothetical protein
MDKPFFLWHSHLCVIKNKHSNLNRRFLHRLSDEGPPIPTINTLNSAYLLHLCRDNLTRFPGNQIEP